MSELLVGVIFGMALGAFIGRRRKQAISVKAQPLPCVLFRKGMTPEQCVAWLRWMADGLEAKHTEDEGRDNAC